MTGFENERRTRLDGGESPFESKPGTNGRPHKSQRKRSRHGERERGEVRGWSVLGEGEHNTHHFRCSVTLLRSTKASEEPNSPFVPPFHQKRRTLTHTPTRTMAICRSRLGTPAFGEDGTGQSKEATHARLLSFSTRGRRLRQGNSFNAAVARRQSKMVTTAPLGGTKKGTTISC